MNLAKKIGQITLAMVLASSMTTHAFAVSSQQPIENENIICYDGSSIVPYWDNINSILPGISKSGTTICAEVSIDAKRSDATIRCTMYLERKTLFGWTEEKYWFVSHRGDYTSLSKEFEGEKGEKYRVRVEVEIDGEEAEATSKTITL